MEQQTLADNTKRIAKNTFLLYVRMLFSVAVSLVTSRLILQVLGVENYGIYNVVGGVVILFTFLNSAMASSTQRFLTFELGCQNWERSRMVFSTSIWIHLLISLSILFLAETVGVWLFYHKLIIPESRMEAAMWVYQLSVCSCIVTIMSVPYNACIIARERMNVFAYISMLDIVLRCVVVLCLYFFPYDKLVVYACLLLLVAVMIRAIYWGYCRSHLPETLLVYRWDRPLFHEMLHFAGWNLFGNMAYVGYTQGVNVLLNIFFGPAVNAARAVAVQLQGTVNNFCNSFQTAMNPQITKSYAAKEWEYMYGLLIGSSKYSFILLLFMTLPIWIEAEQILSLWLGIVPEHTTSFLRIILLVSMVDVMANPLITIAQATGKIRNYQLIVGGVLLLIVPISYLALKFGGQPESVFVVHLSVALVAQFVRLWMVRGLVGLSGRMYLERVILPLLRVVFVAFILPLLVYVIMPESLPRLLLIVVSSCISVLFGGYVFGLERKERAFVHDKIRLLKQKML